MQAKLSNIAIINIIDRLKKVLAVYTDTDLAVKLGVKQNTISSWKTRGTMDFSLIIAQCDNCNLDWLFTGRGEMLKTEQYSAPMGDLDAATASIYKEQLAEVRKENAILLKEIGRLEERLNHIPYHGKDSSRILRVSDNISPYSSAPGVSELPCVQPIDKQKLKTPRQSSCDGQE